MHISITGHGEIKTNGFQESVAKRLMRTLIATRDGLGSVSRQVTRVAKCSVPVVPLEQETEHTR